MHRESQCVRSFPSVASSFLSRSTVFCLVDLSWAPLLAAPSMQLLLVADKIVRPYFWSVRDNLTSTFRLCAVCRQVYIFSFGAKSFGCVISTTLRLFQALLLSETKYQASLLSQTLYQASLLSKIQYQASLFSTTIVFAICGPCIRASFHIFRFCICEICHRPPSLRCTNKSHSPMTSTKI